MSQRLPAEIQRALLVAQREARRFNHTYVGTEHLLLATIEDESGLSANVLQTFGLDTLRIRHEIEKLVGPGPAPPPAGELPLTPRAKTAIEFARQEAQFVNCDDCGGGPLLVGLAREHDGVAGQVLRNLGLSLPMIGGEVFKIRVLQMKLVERTVRPVRASTARKRKMREELLAHLTDIYREEQGRLNNPLAANDEAARRFGDPAQLSRELDRALPAHERRAHYIETWVGWRAPETATKWMHRLALQVFLVLTAVCSIGIAAAVLIGGPDLLDGRFIRGVTSFVVLVSAGMPALGVLFFKLRDAMFGVFGSRKSPTKVLLLQMLIAILTPAGVVTYVAFEQWSLSPVGQFLIPYTAAGIALSVIALVMARLNGPTEIRDTLWACLDIREAEPRPAE
ncbi:MAG: Clp protease N-terminal domain-containing protein [Pirellulales bacterium]